MIQKLKNRFRELLWAHRVRKCWSLANHDYGQFLSNVGCEIAYRRLPKDILDQFQFKEPDNDLPVVHG